MSSHPAYILTFLSRPMAELLVPAGASLEDCWVLCLGQRQHIGSTPEGIPLYGPLVSWAPVLTLSSHQAAAELGERMGAAGLGRVPSLWDWMPADDDPARLELYAAYRIGHQHLHDDPYEEPAEVAIVPLQALICDPSQTAVTG